MYAPATADIVISVPNAKESQYIPEYIRRKLMRIFSMILLLTIMIGTMLLIISKIILSIERDLKKLGK